MIKKIRKNNTRNEISKPQKTSKKKLLRFISVFMCIAVMLAVYTVPVSAQSTAQDDSIESLEQQDSEKENEVSMSGPPEISKPEDDSLEGETGQETVNLPQEDASQPQDAVETQDVTDEYTETEEEETTHILQDENIESEENTAAEKIMDDANAAQPEAEPVSPDAFYTINVSNISPGTVNGAIPGAYVDVFSSTYQDTRLTFNSGAANHQYIITGSSNSLIIQIEEGVSVNLIFDNLRYTARNVSVSPLMVKKGAQVKIQLVEGSYNELTHYETSLAVFDDARLEINGSSGTLKAESSNGAAIGSPSYVLNNDNVKGGQVVINGGKIEAKGINGPGIGASLNTPIQKIEINGGEINAVSNFSAAIGGAYITKENSNGWVEGVYIHGGTVTAESNYAAAIGGGNIPSGKYPSSRVDIGTIYIENSIVNAKSNSAAAIGGGEGDTRASGFGSISIMGNSVVEAHTLHGAAIGTGNNHNQSDLKSGSIIIDGARINASTRQNVIGIGLQRSEGAEMEDIIIRNSELNLYSYLGSGIGKHSTLASSIGKILIDKSSINILGVAENNDIYPVQEMGLPNDGDTFMLNARILNANDMPKTSVVKVLDLEANKTVKEFTLKPGKYSFAQLHNIGYDTGSSSRKLIHYVFDNSGNFMGVLANALDESNLILESKGGGDGIMRQDLVYSKMSLSEPDYSDLDAHSVTLIGEATLLAQTEHKAGFEIASNQEMTNDVTDIQGIQFSDSEDVQKEISKNSSNLELYANTVYYARRYIEIGEIDPIKVYSPPIGFITFPEITSFYTTEAEDQTALLEGTVSEAMPGTNNSYSSYILYSTDPLFQSGNSVRVLTRYSPGADLPEGVNAINGKEFQGYLSDLKKGKTYYAQIIIDNTRVISGKYTGAMVKETISFTTTASYDIYLWVKNNTGGSVKALVDGAEVTSARPGDTVTLISQPDEGYVLDSWTVLDGWGVTLDGNNSFTMPEEDVEIEAEFVLKTQLLNITIPTNMLFASTTTQPDGEIVAPQYTITNNSPIGVEVVLDGFTVSSSAGIELVPGGGPLPPQSMGESIWLNIKGSGADNKAPGQKYGITPQPSGINAVLGKLDAGDSVPQRMKLKLGGQYYGDYGAKVNPQYVMTLKFRPD